MNRGRLLVTVMLLGVTVFVVAGCGKTEQSEPTAEQTQPAPSDTTDNQHPMPPEGGPPTGDQPPAPELDLAAAAAKLGVTEEQLSEALGDQWPLDLTVAAVELGVSEESLREALGIPEGSAFPGGGSPTPELDLETAAAELGVTEEQLSEALGDQWPLDLAAAAEELGVSEESLREALGISEGPAFPGGGGHPPGGGGPADAKEGI